MLIIWDFIQTLYNTHEGVLYPSAIEILKSFKEAGYKQVLASSVVNYLHDERMQLFKELEILNYFDEVILGPKTEETFQAICDKFKSAPIETFVIGDNENNEIRTGNLLKMKTIWIQRKEVNRLRQHLYEGAAWRAVKSLAEVVDIVRDSD